MTPTETKLKPCPFCGLNNVEDTWAASIKCFEHYIECKTCGAKGPIIENDKGETPMGILAAWNQRHEDK